MSQWPTEPVGKRFIIPRDGRPRSSTAGNSRALRHYLNYFLTKTKSVAYWPLITIISTILI